ncbi:hypothetical protein KH5_07600 [Urechidicola sp. KH5]
MLFALFACEKQVQQTEMAVNTNSRIFKFQGAPYLIKGICYHPVPKGSNQRSFENIDQDLKLMLEAGINTIRVYAPIDNIEVLDKINTAGLKVIVGFGYNQNGVYDILSGSFIEYVKKYKNHPAILMWELGNEYNYHPEWFSDDIKNWYNVLNKAAALIHKVDSQHKVTTAHGELPDTLAMGMCNEIDVWGLNIYRWDNPDDLFQQWKRISSKPMYLSEAGGDSYMTISKKGYEKGVNERAQADANANILDRIFENREVCSGVTMFSFTDGWWKAGNNNSQDVGGWAPNSSGVPYDGTPNEEFWGMVDIDRNKKKTFNVIKEKYTSMN